MQKRLGHLALKNSSLVEKFNHARVLVEHRQKQADLAEQAAAHAARVYHHSNVAFTQMIQAQYETGSMSSAGALLDSESGSNYLDRLTTLDLMAGHDADVVSAVTKAKGIAISERKKADLALARAKKQRAAVIQTRIDVQKQIHKYKKLLGMLTAQQQARFEAQQSHATKSPPKQRNLPPAPSSAAKVAVRFALAQVGKPYVWGAAGPDSYDCSGLTMQSWAAAGVSLPHSAADQYNYGTHVSESELQPGDLIFFYTPIEHVTIYIGNGMMVSAPTEGEPVAVVSLAYFQSDYVGATRLT